MFVPVVDNPAFHMKDAYTKKEHANQKAPSFRDYINNNHQKTKIVKTFKIGFLFKRILTDPKAPNPSCPCTLTTNTKQKPSCQSNMFPI